MSTTLRLAKSPVFLANSDTLLIPSDVGLEYVISRGVFLSL